MPMCDNEFIAKSSGVWCGASFNCVVLALNRVVEMIPALQKFRFLFKGAWLQEHIFLYERLVKF